MKTLVLLLSIFMFNILGAQSFVVTPNHNPINGDNWNELLTEVTIENVTSITKNVKIRKFIIDTVPGSTNHFCWGNCFDPDTYISTSPLTIPGLTINDTDFSVHLTPNGTEGVSRVKYCAYDINNLADSACITITYSHFATSNTESLNEDFSCNFYPNPSRGDINFNYYLPNHMYADLFLSDVLGNKVYSSNLNSGSQKIVLRDLKKGMYFAEVLVNGKFKESFKIIVSY